MVPYPITGNYECEIMRLVNIVNERDWKCVDVILYRY